MVNKISQKKACFLLLYQAKGNYLPAYYFVGERLVLETTNTPEMTVFLSYKAPVRLSDLFYDYIGVEREEVIGKSGAKYYKYRFNHKFIDDLPDELKKLL